jgi:dTMP kinase
MSGTFVTFEGIEGSGKSTQAARLAERLRRSGREVVLTREPGGTVLGRQLRALLLRTGSPVLPEAELLLYAADRAQHVGETIAPALARGAAVLCDRFLDATLAYQGVARGLGTEAVLSLHRRPPLDLRPQRTVLLDLDPEAALARARGRDAARMEGPDEGRFEAEPHAFHRKVREGYLRLAGAEPERMRVVAAAGSESEVEAAVLREVLDLFPDLRGGA